MHIVGKPLVWLIPTLFGFQSENYTTKYQVPKPITTPPHHHPNPNYTTKYQVPKPITTHPPTNTTTPTHDHLSLFGITSAIIAYIFSQAALTCRTGP
jgi:hypothetical protein